MQPTVLGHPLVELLCEWLDPTVEAVKVGPVLHEWLNPTVSRVNEGFANGFSAAVRDQEKGFSWLSGSWGG